MILFDLAESGHRAGYLSYLAEVFHDRRPERILGRSWRHWRKLVGADRVFLSSADHYPAFAFSVGLARRLAGKRSGALFIAAEKLGFKSGWGSGLKRTLFETAKRLGILDACTITPFDLAPGVERMCVAWVHDLQFGAPNQTDGSFDAADEVELSGWTEARLKEGRGLVVLLGNLGGSRGVPEFLEAAGRALADLNAPAFLVAGSFSSSDLPEVGGLPPDRLRLHPERVSEMMFSHLLRAASLVWCYFPPEYDQNSGLFCNAVREGGAVVIRRGSYLERFASSHLPLEIDPDPPAFIPADALVLRPSRPVDGFLADCSRRNREILRGLRCG